MSRHMVVDVARPTRCRKFASLFTSIDEAVGLWPKFAGRIVECDCVHGGRRMSLWWLSFKGGATIIVRADTLVHARLLAAADKVGRAYLLANLCGGIASRFRPTLVNGKPTWNTKDELELFDRFMHKSCLYAHWGAPYQDPTYRAIAVLSAPSDAFARGQLPSNVVEIRDAQTAANEYRRIVCGSKASS
jgi:hypothetical protein